MENFIRLCADASVILTWYLEVVWCAHVFPRSPITDCGLIDPVSLAHPTKRLALQVLNFTQPIGSLGGSIKVFMHYLCVHEFRKLLYMNSPLFKKHEHPLACACHTLEVYFISFLRACGLGVYVNWLSSVDVL